MVNYTILLPPSEGKLSGGDEKIRDISFPELEKYREGVYFKLLGFLKTCSLEELEKLVDLKGEKALNYKNIMLKLGEGPFSKAIDRYSGVMFKAIEYGLMEEYTKTNFDNTVIFVDALYGLLRPTDTIDDYKLKIASKIGDFDLTKFWKEKLITHFLEIIGDNIIIDILPDAHRKVIPVKDLDNYYRIFFGRIKNGKLVSEGHLSKKLKGEFVNYLVGHFDISIEDLKEFKHSDGFSYSEEYSNENLIVYLKE